MTSRYAKVKAKAEELLEKYALTTPVQIFELAKLMGIKWQGCDPSSLSKVVTANEPEIRDNTEFANWEEVLGYYNKKDKTFYINEVNQPITRVRFTLAHEIGHHQLHEHIGKNHFRSVVLAQDMYKPRYPEEAEANYFAGYLLMPDKAITKILPYSDLMPLNGEYIIREFAKMLAVSPEAMRVRLRTFKEENPDIWSKYNMTEKLF